MLSGSSLSERFVQNTDCQWNFKPSAFDDVCHEALLISQGMSATQHISRTESYLTRLWLASETCIQKRGLTKMMMMG